MTAEPFESKAVFHALPLLERDLVEVFGEDAAHARLRNISAFTDVSLKSLMERVHEELMRRHASRFFWKASRKPSPSIWRENIAKRSKSHLAAARPCLVVIALDVGYANPSHFARFFRRETGLTSSDYRRQR